MSPVRIWSLLACLALAGVAWAAEPAPADLPASFTLVRAPCDDFCPGYTVSISSDGTVVFDGREWVTWQGLATKQVPVARLAPLLQKLRDINFWQIDGKGDGRVMLPNGTVTLTLPPNRPVYSVTVFQGDKSKQVQGITGGRYAEGDLPELIDQVADIADWIERSTRKYGDPASARVAPVPPTSGVALALPATPQPASPTVQPSTPPPAPRSNRVLTAIVAAQGNQGMVTTPGQAPTLVGSTSDGGSFVTAPGQPPTRVVLTPGGGSMIITSGEAPTTVMPIAGGGTLITPPGQPPSTMVPTPGGGSTIYTPGEAPTMVVPTAGGGSIIYAPGQPPVVVMPTN